MYKKKRTKRKNLKKYHKKHHPDSEETEKSLPWNVFCKEIRKNLNIQQNNHVSDDSLYCCWEEDWTLKETIEESIDAFNNNYNLRC